MQRRDESSFIFTLARSAAQTISEGYYRTNRKASDAAKEHRSLKESLVRARLTPLIAEIKFTSPAEGKLREVGDVRKIAESYERAGVSGISVLTEPKHFDGDIGYLPLVKSSSKLPVLMKDIIIDPVQIDAAAEMGADAVLFISAIFMNRLSTISLEEMFSRARSHGLEVLFEAHTENEYRFALESDADLVGINNRNLDTLEVSLATSRTLLAMGRDRRAQLKTMDKDKVVISESGINSRKDIDELRELGADGFLIGSAFMKSEDLEAKVRSLTGASR